MKKHLKLTALLLVIVIFSSLLTACLPVPLEALTGMVLATTLETRAQAKLSKAKSYTATSEMLLSCVVSGVTVSYTAKIDKMVSNAGAADAQYHTKFNYKTVLSDNKGNKRSKTSSMEHGLLGGEGFMRTKMSDQFMLQVKSPLTEAEYLEFLEYGQSSAGHSYCGSASAKKREDGGWSASFTDFDSASLGALATEYGITQFSTDITINDAVYSFELGSDLMYESAKLEFEFADSTSKLTITTIYTDIGETVCEIPPISHYDNVSDMRLATKLRMDMADYVKEKNGEFTLVIDYMKNDTVIGGLDRSGEFGTTDDGKFFFRAKKVDGWYEEYADGKVTETQGRTYDVSESTAIMYITSLLNPMNFSELSVDTFRKDGNTIYFDIVLPDNFFYNATGGKYSSSQKKVTLEATYKDERLSKITFTASGSGGYLSQVNKLRLTITYGEQ